MGVDTFQRRHDTRRESSLLATDQAVEFAQIRDAFARRIVTQLHGAGFVNTRRGIGGGVGLARSPEHITLREIVHSLDGPIFLNECTKDPACCGLAADCPTRATWQRADALLDEFLQQQNLAGLAGLAPGDDHHQYEGGTAQV